MYYSNRSSIAGDAQNKNSTELTKAWTKSYEKLVVDITRVLLCYANLLESYVFNNTKSRKSLADVNSKYDFFFIIFCR